MNHQLAVLAVIKALTAEVNLLESELAQLQSSTVIAATSTYIPPIQTFTPPTMNDENNVGSADAPVATTTISVTFQATSTGDGYVTINNTSDVAVRVTNLDVDGTLAGITDGPVYGEGFVYAPAVKDASGNEHSVLSCTGVGSDGMVQLPGGGTIDPCRRRDANLAKNELQPGETMVLRYTGQPTAVTYQPGSIIELNSGADVQF